ncbi:MAG: hypothetical protein OEM26_13385, partial [Saprospiraceae bacterium]|nr:hypothetical protein [Saprospiraceae bacterium]
MLKHILFFTVMVSILACTSSDSVTNSIDEQLIDDVLTEISSDHYLGRKPFTEGETRTIEYLQDQFKSMGIEPGNGNSYLQEVPLVAITGKP